MDRKYKITPSGKEDSDAVHQLLRSYNRRFTPSSGNYSFHIKDSGELIAGIVAAATFDTLEVEFLYVSEARRGQGLGSRLLKYAEDKAAADGLRRVLLNTYSYQAPGFYEKLGYQKLFEISPCFGPYSQFFYVKLL